MVLAYLYSQVMNVIVFCFTLSARRNSLNYILILRQSMGMGLPLCSQKSILNFRWWMSMVLAHPYPQVMNGEGPCFTLSAGGSPPLIRKATHDLTMAGNKQHRELLSWVELSSPRVLCEPQHSRPGGDARDVTFTLKLFMHHIHLPFEW